MEKTRRVYITIPLYFAILDELKVLIKEWENSPNKRDKEPSPLDACNSIVKRLQNGK